MLCMETRITKMPFIMVRFIWPPKCTLHRVEIWPGKVISMMMNAIINQNKCDFHDETGRLQEVTPCFGSTQMIIAADIHTIFHSPPPVLNKK